MRRSRGSYKKNVMIEIQHSRGAHRKSEQKIQRERSRKILKEKRKKECSPTEEEHMRNPGDSRGVPVKGGIKGEKAFKNRNKMRSFNPRGSDLQTIIDKKRAVVGKSGTDGRRITCFVTIVLREKTFRTRKTRRPLQNNSGGGGGR